MKRVLGIAIVAIVVVGVVWTLHVSRPDSHAQETVEETRLKLRQQGFKTDLSDFDFSTSAELRSREAIFNAAVPGQGTVPYRDHPDLRETVGNSTVIVVWKQDSLKRAFPPGPEDTMTWEEFRTALNTNQAQVDAACDAVMSGPIAFDLDAGGGYGLRLPHLAMLRNFTHTLGSRCVLDLHDGNLDAAWTNVMAATRLVTAWEPEPTEISQLVRFGNTRLAFNAIWQALQTNGWPDEKLARLQQEWEAADFFKPLPGTAAFLRASSVAACEQQRNSPTPNGPSLLDFSKFSIQHPASAWSEWKYRSEYLRYLKQGSYEDEANLLIFYCDREVELRNAFRAATWLQMRQLPGVTNEVPFQSKYRYGIVVLMNSHKITLDFQKRGAGLLGRAAEAEARRRILVTAIALQRYYEKRGAYPPTLAGLEPDYVKKVPVDFMDGQPLRYRLTDDGHFVLYSVGLDCVDNGGTIQTREKRMRANAGDDWPGMQSDADIVWPRPASSALVAELRQEEMAERENKADEFEELQVRSQWDHAARHQAGAEKLLAAGAAQNPPDTSYHGRPLSEILRNKTAAGTNRLTLGEMLTLKQVITGEEPETVTFEAPIAYDALSSLGKLHLCIDTNNDDSDEGCAVQQMEFNRADNGNCRLVWSTIYESPGRHALQMVLEVNDVPPDSGQFGGPLLPFTITNLCQFSVTTMHFDETFGATFHAKLAEANGNYTIELNNTDGARLKTITGSTSNGVLKEHWDLTDEHGRRFTNELFETVFHLTLPDSGRTQALRGP